MPRLWTAFVAVMAMPISVYAQAPQFRWIGGQSLVYRVSQNTAATETGDKTAETSTKLDLVKRWKIDSVDTNGIATLTMSLDRLRMETKSPSGETLLFDSADPAKSTPALKEELTKYINTPLTVVRLDSRGQIVEVKESKFGPPSRLTADLPFKIVLPTTPLQAGATWERKYQIKLEPPQGAGEVHEALQKLSCKSVAGSSAVITVATDMLTQPDTIAGQIPLMPLQPAGEIVFDLAAGRLKSVKFQIQKEIEGHSGEGSKYRYVSTYVEELIN